MTCVCQVTASDRRSLTACSRYSRQCYAGVRVFLTHLRYLPDHLQYTNESRSVLWGLDCSTLPLVFVGKY